MPRFYCPQPLVAGATVSLPEAVAHHIQVVRLAPGDVITLFNGEGGEVQASLWDKETMEACEKAGVMIL